MTNLNFKQFKLTNGEEIIADVLESEEDILIIRAAMKIVEVEHLEEGYSYFAFRPFISFQDSVDTLQLLGSQHIITETTPSHNLLKHYASAVGKMSKFLKGGKTLEEFESMSEEEVESYIQDFLDRELEEAALDGLLNEEEDEDLGENVIRFNPRNEPDGTLH